MGSWCTMKHTLSWNCRGLGSIPAVNALRRIVINEQPSLVFLQETRMKQSEMENIRKKLHFKNMLVVNCEGEGRRRKGGLCLLWKEEWDVKIISFSTHHIDAEVVSDGREEWRFTGYYGWPEDVNKHKTGELMKMLYKEDNKPWLCGGDFNVMMWSNEKQGGGDFKFEDAAMFREALDYCLLEDLHFTGHPFTWTNNQGGDKNLQERLDCFVANEGWRGLFGGAYVSHLTKRRSDHLPIILTLKKSIENPRERRRKKLFRFEEMWARENSCENVIKEAWEEGDEMKRKMLSVTRKLREWSNKNFGEFAKEMRGCQVQMKRLMEEQQTEDIIAQMRSIDARMDELEKREEIFWKQRSRQEWLKHGEKNTKFFHAKAKQRIARNSITSLKDECGREYNEEEEISELLVNHFADLFTANEDNDTRSVIDKVQTVVPQGLMQMLEEPYTREEIQIAIKQMHPTKEPGPDGMCAFFYQHYWNIVGVDIENEILEILNNNGDIRPLNQTHLVLIPKKKMCEYPVDFRPISLCNVTYKLVAKVLANRLKKILSLIIHESQSGFVPGRLITDNILVAYECFHYMRKKKSGKEGFMGLKLDMSKAYDRVEWRFLEQMMIKMGFPGVFVELIINCVKMSSFSILVNGQPSRNFSSTRGLRQGDPLSPFLFIICAEGLSSFLRDAEEKKKYMGSK